ncbi:MAG TPA: hypothetical protein VNQ99_04835 [Xanthobacteraceae bacterium]|nr:hypothetical protein [Xanthobacteraceae bacterium]
MGAISQALAYRERIDFAAVSNAARNALISLVQEWLPDGKREGSEYVARNPTRNDAHSGSFKINLTTGVWSDFATGEAGGDAIDLLAYLNRTPKLDAAREIAQRLGVASGSISAPSLVPVAAPKALTPITNLAVAPAAFPARTPPDQDGKPRL